MKTKLLITLLLCALPLLAIAQETFDLTLDKPERYGLVPKGSFIATWHLRVPEEGTPKYVLFLIPNAQGVDSLVQDFSHVEWQDFAKRNHLAVLTVGFDYKTDVPRHERLELWSGKMLPAALKDLAAKAGKPELAELPLLTWGTHDVGSAMAQNLAAWNKVNIAAFVSNAGNNFPNAKDAEKVPGLFVMDDKPMFKKQNDSTLEVLAMGRRRNALWCLAPNKLGAREYAMLSMVFFEAVMADKKEPWIGNLKDKTIVKAADAPAGTKDTVWLPDEDFAHTWQLFVGGGNE
jgi:hypothetical protein